MTTKEAIEYVLEHDAQAKPYRLAKALSCSHTTIKNYLLGATKMSDKVYKRFREIYPEIEIDDIYEIKPTYKLGELK